MGLAQAGQSSACPDLPKALASELAGGHLQGLLQEHPRLPFLPMLPHHAGIGDPPDRAVVRFDPFHRREIHAGRASAAFSVGGSCHAMARLASVLLVNPLREQSKLVWDCFVNRQLAPSANAADVDIIFTNTGAFFVEHTLKKR